MSTYDPTIPVYDGTLLPMGNVLQVFNVRQYGATGDGVHDDSTAFQHAANAAQAAGGGVVWVPATPSNNYAGTTTITFASGVSCLLARADTTHPPLSVTAGTLALSGAYVGSGSGKNAGATAATVATSTSVTGDTNDRLQIDADGSIHLGPGNAALDLTISRIVESSVTELSVSKPIVPASYVKVTGDPGNGTAIYEALANSGAYARLALLESGVGTVLITKPAGAEQVQFWDGSSTSWVAQIDTTNSIGNVRLSIKGITGQTGDLAQFNVAGTGPTLHVDNAASLIVDDGATTKYRLLANSATLYLQHNNDINFCDVNSGTARAVVGVDGHIGIQKNSTGANLYSGTGAPAVGTGSNGDFYLRTDTPGTANQRIYTKSAGAWVGIV